MPDQNKECTLLEVQLVEREGSYRLLNRNRVKFSEQINTSMSQFQQMNRIMKFSSHK
jgi:hypothetical protein